MVINFLNKIVMKKIVLCMWAVFIFSGMVAQTNFRNLTYEQALEVAKTEKKLVLLDFYTVWCGPCKMMTKEVFPQKAVGEYLNERFVCIQLDAEKEGKELRQQFKVMFYPTFIGLDVSGKELFRIEGGTDAKTFMAHVDRLINPEKSPARVKKRYEAGERNAELIRLYASMKMAESKKTRQGDPAKKEEALQIVRDYFKGLKKKDRLNAENLFIYMEYVETPLDEIAKYMVANEKRFAPAEREQVRRRVEDLYGNYLAAFFSGKTPFDKSAYEQVKRDVEVLGLNADHRYDLMFQFIECHAAGDLSAYLDLFEREYENLPEIAKTVLVHGFPLLVDTKEEAVVRRALQMVRGRLADMSIRTLFGVSDVIFALENRLQDEK